LQLFIDNPVSLQVPSVHSPPEQPLLLGERRAHSFGLSDNSGCVVAPASGADARGCSSTMMICLPAESSTGSPVWQST
jgi:hypothetical protein